MDNKIVKRNDVVYKFSSFDIIGLILGMVLLLIGSLSFIFIMIYYYRPHLLRRSSRRTEVLPVQQVDMTYTEPVSHEMTIKKYIEIIPKVSYGGLCMNTYSVSECVICLEKFKQNENLRQLSTCGHLYH